MLENYGNTPQKQCCKSLISSPQKFGHLKRFGTWNTTNSSCLNSYTAIFSFIAGKHKDSTDTTSSSGDSSISTAAVQSIVDKLKGERNRSSTRENYYKIWRKFNQFFIRLDTKLRSWEDRLVLFVGYLVNLNCRSSTIKSYISAICAVLKEDGEDLNEDVYLLNSLTRACHLQNDVMLIRLPIRKPVLCLLLNNVQNCCSQPYLITLYKAMLSTAYFGLFRIGELTLSEHVLKAKDVHVGKNKNKMMFILHSSKTHGLESAPQIIKIYSNSYNVMGKELALPVQETHANKFCPFQMLREYLQVRKLWKSDQEQFFVFKDRTPVTAVHFHSQLKKLLIVAGLDQSLYTVHSLCAGHACDMLNLYSVGIEDLKKIGRWKSNSIYAYLKQ